MVPTLKVVGAHVRISQMRYVAGFAVVEDAAFVRAVSLPAPAHGDEASQLEELHRAVTELLADIHPDALALRVSEAVTGSRNAHQAEGAILAAAGAVGVPVKQWVGAGLLKPSGLKSGSFAQRIAALCAQVSDAPAKPKEIVEAVAAARASIVRS
jgi:Holliday junction resolvasome RuvABC endonuclease subunit